MKELKQNELLEVNGGLLSALAFTGGSIIGAALANKLGASTIYYGEQVLLAIPQVAVVAAGAIALGSVCYGLTEGMHSRR